MVLVSFFVCGLLVFMLMWLFFDVVNINRFIMLLLFVFILFLEILVDLLNCLIVLINLVDVCVWSFLIFMILSCWFIDIVWF